MFGQNLLGRSTACGAESRQVEKNAESSFQPVGLPALNACYNPKVYSWQKTGHIHFMGTKQKDYVT
ncbi:MAG: hypothetical protein DRJ05_08510 [Bacteroidetes bacterium]|nr:MAG: hypothetical protein DRJ05_08510 [Bacteroidota bacterium]